MAQRNVSTHVRITHATYQMLSDLADEAAHKKRTKKRQVQEIVETLLEIAFRCCLDHGTDFAKPSGYGQARKSFWKKIEGQKRPKRRKPGRPKGSKDSKPRVRRKP